MRSLFPALILLVCTSCQVLAPEGTHRRAQAPATVTVLDLGEENAVTDDCEKVADLSVRPPFPLLAQRYPELSSFGQAEVNAELRSRAVQAGADTVLPTELIDGRTHAEAYNCGGAG